MSKLGGKSTLLIAAAVIAALWIARRHETTSDEDQAPAPTVQTPPPADSSPPSRAPAAAAPDQVPFSKNAPLWRAPTASLRPAELDSLIAEIVRAPDFSDPAKRDELVHAANALSELPLDEMNKRYEDGLRRLPDHASELKLGWSYSLARRGLCPQALALQQTVPLDPNGSIVEDARTYVKFQCRAP